MFTNSPVLLQRPVQELVACKGLSSREMNLAKRRARAAFSKQKSRDCDDSSSASPLTPLTPAGPPPSPLEPDRKRMKIEPVDEALCELLFYILLKKVRRKYIFL